MVDIAPLRGIRYNPNRMTSLCDVIAPPYDVISPARQAELHGRHETNIIRIDFGRDKPDDNGGENRYTRAAGYLQRWIHAGILARDPEPCIYIYQQEYVLESGEPKVRTGLLCLVRLEPLDKGIIMAHERTFEHPMSDRLKLALACKALTSPIYGIFADPDRGFKSATQDIVYNDPPAAHCMDDTGVAHRLWVVSDTGIIAQVQDAMRHFPVYIADGHHRYETSLKLRQLKHEEDPEGAAPYDYTLMFLSNTESSGLTILPAYRVIRDVSERALSGFRDRLAEFFTIEEHPDMSMQSLIQELARRADRHVFAFYKGHGGPCIFELKHDVNLKAVIPRSMSEVRRSLDVTVLRELVIDQLLDSENEDLSREGNILYAKLAAEAKRMVDNKNAALAFYHNPVKVQQVKDVASQLERMPHKSTYFYPKIPAGLVIHKFY